MSDFNLFVTPSTIGRLQGLILQLNRSTPLQVPKVRKDQCQVNRRSLNVLHPITLFSQAKLVSLKTPFPRYECDFYSNHLSIQTFQKWTYISGVFPLTKEFPLSALGVPFSFYPHFRSLVKLKPTTTPCSS